MLSEFRIWLCLCLLSHLPAWVYCIFKTTESTLCSFHRNEAHFHLHLCISYKCIWGWHLQKPAPDVIWYCFAMFISLWGSTHDSVDCWSAHSSPIPAADRDSFKRVHHCHWYVVGCQIKILASNREKVYFWPYTQHELLLSISPVRGHRSGFYISIWFRHFNHCHVLFHHIHKYLLLGLPCFIFPGRSILSIPLPSSPHARWE